MTDFFKPTNKALGDIARTHTSWGSLNPSDAAKAANPSLNKSLLPDANGNKSLIADVGKDGTGAGKMDSRLVKGDKPAGNKFRKGDAGGLPE